MALTQEQVTLITVAALGKAPGANHLNYFTTSATAGEFKVNGGTTNINTLLPYASDLEAVAAVLQHERAHLEAKNGLLAQTDAQFVASVVANLGAADGASLAADLQGGMARYKALVKFALAEQAKGPIANVTNATGSLDDVEQDLIATGTPANPGNEIYLTVGSDRNVATTAGDDVIVANVVNNDLGILINELSTGDVIDGGAGHDVLKASLVRDNRWDNDIDPRPTVKNVEEIRIEALENVTLDADRISNELHYASDRSRSDLTITNVAIEDKQITQDITLEMKNTIANNSNLSLNSATPGMGSNFAVYFDETSLRAKPEAIEAAAEFYIQLADSLQEDAAAPLTNVRITDLIVKHDGNTITLSNIESDDNTYEGLVRAVQAALDEAGFGGRYKAELGAEFNEVANVATKVPGFNVVVKDTNEPAVSFAEEDVQIGVGNKIGSGSSASVQGDSGVVFDSSKQTFKVTSDIILDGVGRGSNGGDLTIGSMSTSNSSTGVQVFDIEVRNNSNLGDFYSTNGALEELRIVNGEGYTGNLTLRNELNDSNDHNSINGGEKILVESFAGNINLGTVNAIKNVDVIDARGVTGNVTLNAEYNGNGLASDAQDFVINTGTGHDVITASVEGTSVSGSTDTNLTITAKGGNNTITLSSNDNAEVEVITGSGADTVTGGATNLTANTGAGNDVIYAENTGAKAVVGIDTAAAAAAFTTATPATAGGTTYAPGNIHFLAGKELQVTLAVADATSTTAASAFTAGFESKVVTIEAAKGALTTMADLNNAIIKAINEDAVLNKLAFASVDSNGTLMVQYLVDGVQTPADAFSVNVRNPATMPTASSAMQKEYRDLVNNSTLSATDIQTLYVDAAGTGAGVDIASADIGNLQGSTITVGTPTGAVGNTITIQIGDETITVETTGATAATDSADIAKALQAKGYNAVSDGTSAVAILGEFGDITVSDDTTMIVATYADTTSAPAIITTTLFADLLGTESTSATSVNVVNAGAGDDVIVLSSEGTAADKVVFTDYNQGNDTIVHFESGTDKLDFTTYLTGTVPGDSLGSTSSESAVTATITAVASEVFTANSINLIDYSALGQMVAEVSFNNMTIAQLTAALNADTSSTVTANANLNGTTAKSVLVIRDTDHSTPITVPGAYTENEGTYKAYELSYDNTAKLATDTKAFTVKLIGTFDLGEDVLTNTDFAV